jgi:hypothetical protein
MNHSQCAALFGICECDECVSIKANNEDTEMIEDIENYYLWTIRSKDVVELEKHRVDMIDMGFHVGKIKRSRGWKVDSLPSEFFLFSAEIRKSNLSNSDYESLCSWDRKYGTI